MVEAKPNLDDLGRPRPGGTHGTERSRKTPLSRVLKNRYGRARELGRTTPEPTITNVGAINPEGGVEGGRFGAFHRDKPKTPEQRKKDAQDFVDKAEKEAEKEKTQKRIATGLKANIALAILRRTRGSGKPLGSPDPPGDVFKNY